MARTVKLLKNGADPVGAPDFTLPVSIIAQLIPQLDVNIAAQSIPTLNINIASISQGITVTTTVSNMPSTFPLPSDQISTLQQITIQNIAAGLVFNVNVSQITATLNINNWPSEYPLPSAQVSTLQQITIQNVAAGLYIPINVAQASATINTNANISGVVAGVYVPITIHSVDSGVVFNIDITKVESGVTFNVNITGTPTINVQTSGGANIVIDKLTQAAYTERRSPIQNHGATPTLVAGNYTNIRGKFFPRGCRGHIYHLYVYCDNTDSVAHTFTIKLSPMPGMGPVMSFSLSVPAGSSDAWRYINVNKFWNYDSMFIWVRSDSDTYGRLAYEVAEPYDYYGSTDEVTWTPDTYRYWFFLYIYGETVGDLPVSGIVNTIEIPALSSTRQAQTLNVPSASEVYDTVQLGTGELLICIFRVEGVNARDYLIPRIRCDGVQILPFDDTIRHWHDWFVTQSSPGICIGVWDTSANEYSIIVAVQYPFRRTLEVGYYNTYTSALTGTVGYSYKKIS
jgi:hypothetical protein